MGSVRTKDFQVACRKQWEARYGVQSMNVGNHPNAYAEEAQAVLRGDHPSVIAAGGAAALVPGEGVVGGSATAGFALTSDAAGVGAGVSPPQPPTGDTAAADPAAVPV